MEHSAGKPAPYGRACINCARAKCKCILRDEGSSCERCSRLKKQCTPSPTVRKKRQRGSNSQTARLEQKLDGLVSLLKSGNRNNDYFGNTSADASPEWGLNGNRQSETAEASHRETPTSTNKTVAAHTISSLTNSISPLTPVSESLAPFPYAIPPDADVSAEDSEHYVHMFRTQYLKFFPFFWLREGKTSLELRQEYPFLWLSIMSISSTLLPQQMALARVVREVTSQEIIMKGERSIDLLLGLLCVVAWGHAQVHLGPLLAVFSHLIIAVANDLELHKAPTKDFTKIPGCPPPNIHYKFKIPNTRTMEHRRTILACFLLTASFASNHQRNDGMSWSPYLDQCLKILEESKEAPDDEFLVNWIKIQHIKSKSVEIFTQIRDSDHEESTRSIGSHVFSLKHQLEYMKEQIPSYIATNQLLQLSLYSAEMAIHELVLLRLEFVPLAREIGSQTIDGLFGCLRAIRSFLDILLQYKPTEYLGLSFFIWKQMSSAVFLLARLVSLGDPGWDVGYVKRVVDLPSTLGQFSRNIEYLVNVSGWKSATQENVYMRSTRMLGLMSNWAQSIYHCIDQATGTAATQEPISMHQAGALATFEDQEPGRRHEQQNHTATGEAMVTAQPMQIPNAMQNAPIVPTFEPEFWSDDMFGLWDIHSGRGFTFEE
ncbi:hypothetical protein BGW36DRAFT_88931 [Talaromyces proteolyticus]|uniref:Zn(2)-C6 fungal-type domain-containing protein n=1 Tax=Talaromyces proteolyticus TaxID=1131652 RepID=A0AAD4Q4T2_9EURO|nr:uncharacterized protein BGW36DRAFT_88931 [Talaromyces proteolyticus]KAH8703596.1 hypothetical protein BGW36DRAFT_88931 [Talaromyces proteolyticus]